MTNDTISGAGFLDRFGDHLVATGKSSHTVKAYTRDVRLFSEWFDQTNGKGLTPSGITPIDVREYRSYLLTVKNYKPATVNRKLSSISAFCKWARGVGLISANPADEISQVDEVRPAPKWLDKNEQYALLRAVQEKGRKRDIALITLMLNTGLRVSEVSKLRLEDVEISPRKGSVTVRGGKGGKFRRVPLNIDTRKAIQAYLSENPPEEDGHLFVSQRGGPLQPSGIYYLVNRYAYDARLDEVTPHTLRHTFGKNLVDAGVSLDRVAQLLGHESVDTTRIYTTPSEQDLQRDVDRIALT
jgi:site-specific recombinase XerD